MSKWAIFPPPEGAIFKQQRGVLFIQGMAQKREMMEQPVTLLLHALYLHFRAHIVSLHGRHELKLRSNARTASSTTSQLGKRSHNWGHVTSIRGG